MEMLEKVTTFLLEIDLAAGYITETVARRSGDLQIEKHSRHDCQHAMWPSEAHEFDTPDVQHFLSAITLLHFIAALFSQLVSDGKL